MMSPVFLRTLTWDILLEQSRSRDFRDWPNFPHAFGVSRAAEHMSGSPARALLQPGPRAPV
jgi:hypothetical protein